MAVQQNKKSPSKRNMRRSHDALRNPTLSIEPSSGEVHLRHHISPNGYYRGKQVIQYQLEKHKTLRSKSFSVHAASEVVAMDDPIEIALRKKKDSSMRIALSLV